MCDEKGFILIWFGRLMDCGMPLHAGVHRHIAKIIRVQCQSLLGIQWRCVEETRRRESRLNQRLRDPMVRDVEEPRGLASPLDVARHLVKRICLTVQVWSKINDRELGQSSVEVVWCIFLKTGSWRIRLVSGLMVVPCPENPHRAGNPNSLGRLSPKYPSVQPVPSGRYPTVGALF